MRIIAHKFCLSTSFSFLSSFFFLLSHQREGERRDAAPINARRKNSAFFFYFLFDFPVDRRSRTKGSSFSAGGEQCAFGKGKEGKRRD